MAQDTSAKYPKTKPRGNSEGPLIGRYHAQKDRKILKGSKIRDEEGDLAE